MDDEVASLVVMLAANIPGLEQANAVAVASLTRLDGLDLYQKVTQEATALATEVANMLAGARRSACQWNACQICLAFGGVFEAIF